MSNPSERKCIRSTTTILDLNDDVMRDTFRYLNAPDLCAVADVCSAFKRNAQAEFSLRYKDLCFDIWFSGSKNRCRKGKSYDDTVDLRLLAPALRNFGPSFNAINIWLNSREQSHEVLKLVTQYCGEALSDLSLSRFDLTDSAIDGLRPCLSHLQVLTLFDCQWKSESLKSTMISCCSELHSLTIWSGTNVDAVVPLPNLKSISFMYDRDVTNETIKHFLAINPQLKRIELSYCRRITSKIISFVAEYTPQIETVVFELHYSVNERGLTENAMYLKRLMALKSLEIDCRSQSFSPVLKELAAAHIPLECLNIYRFYSDRDFVNELSEWKQLKKLGMQAYTNLEFSDILQIVSNLPELTELELQDHDSDADLVEIVRCAPKLVKLILGLNRMDENLFMKIRDVVAKRKQLCPLTLYQRSVPEELIKLNGNIIKVERIKIRYP